MRTHFPTEVADDVEENMALIFGATPFLRKGSSQCGFGQDLAEVHFLGGNKKWVDS